MIRSSSTRGLSAKQSSGFRGQTLTLAQQRALFRRWTLDPTLHPHEALVGILALLHGASSREVRHLRVEDIEPADRTILLGQRPHPGPLDPARWQILQRYLAHRQFQRTDNPMCWSPGARKPAEFRHRPSTSATCSIPALSRRTRCTAPA